MARQGRRLQVSLQYSEGAVSLFATDVVSVDSQHKSSCSNFSRAPPDCERVPQTDANDHMGQMQSRRETIRGAAKEKKDMRLVITSLMLLAVLTGLGTVTSPASAGCSLDDFHSGCSDGDVTIGWIESTQGCQLTVVEIDRKCGSGAYAPVEEDGPYSAPFVDYDVPACLSNAYTYRLKVRCVCNNEETFQFYEVGPISCQ